MAALVTNGVNSLNALEFKNKDNELSTITTHYLVLAKCLISISSENRGYRNGTFG